MQAREKHLFNTLQLICGHPVVAEHDRGANNYSVRICTECTLREEAWVDEAGMSSGFEKLVGAENRTIKQVSMAEIAQYETLQDDNQKPAAEDGVAVVMKKTLLLAQDQLGNYKKDR
jgi:hypothetical protein